MIHDHSALRKATFSLIKAFDKISNSVQYFIIKKMLGIKIKYTYNLKGVQRVFLHNAFDFLLVLTKDRTRPITCGNIHRQ